jgi:hypothetical protein
MKSILALLFAVPLFAQTPHWVSPAGGLADPAGMVALEDGSSIVAYTLRPCKLPPPSELPPDFRNRMAVAKVSASGKTVYDVELPRPKEVVATLRGPSAGVIAGIAALSDGDLIVVAAFIEGSPWLLRLDGDNGGVRFSKFIGDEKGLMVITRVVSVGDDVIIGGVQETDLYVARYSGNGQKRWERVVNSGGAEAVKDLAVMRDGSVVATAMVEPAPGAKEAQSLLIRFDASGNVAGQRRFDGEAPVLAVGPDRIAVAFDTGPERRQTLRVRLFDTALRELEDVPFDVVSTSKRLIARGSSFDLIYGGVDKIRIASLSPGKPKDDVVLFDARYALDLHVAAVRDFVSIAFTDSTVKEEEKACPKVRVARISLQRGTQ